MFTPRARALLGLLLAPVLLCVLAEAWGPEGHQIIAQLAQNMLSNDAWKEANRLLNGQTLVDVCTEADDYAHTSEGDWSKCLHFVNMGLTQTAYDPTQDCGTINGVQNCCVVAAVLNYTTLVTKQVEDTAQDFQSDDDDQEPVPLAFLVHFVGDAHQPLHVGYTCDEGGNLVNITIFGDSDNLHSSWDTTMLQHYNSNYYNFANQLQSELNSNKSLAANYSSSMDPASWADESFTLVRNDCYVFNRTESQNSARDTSTYPGNCPLGGVTNLPDSYYSYNINIIKQRLMAAGVRLGTLLNQILVQTK